MYEQDIICRNCNKITFNNYYGFCSSACCADFAVKNKISHPEEKEAGCHDEDVDRLEEEVRELENDGEYFKSENSCLYDDIGEYKKDLRENRDLIEEQKKEIKELESLDWKKIKEERAYEKKCNDDLKLSNETLISHRDKVKSDNKLLYNQNLELLEIIKK